jgi:uncharacterized membrane protein HdeD (DUF308 family)
MQGGSGQIATRALFYFIAFVLLIIGINDVTEQLKDGDNFSWPLPIFLFGLGGVIPIILFLYPHLFSNENSGSSSDDNFESQDDGGFGSGD